MRKITVCLAIVAVASMGCSRRQDAVSAVDETPESRQEALVETLRLEVETLRAAGKTNDAVTRLERAFDDSAFEASRPVVFQWLLRLLVEGGKLSDFALRVPLLLQTTDRTAVERILWLALDQAVQAEDADAVNAMIEAIERGRETPDEFWRIVSLARIDLMLKQGASADAEVLLWEKALVLADPDLVPRMRRLGKAMADAGDEKGAERLARRAIEELKTRPMTRDDMVTSWVRQAAREGKADAFLLRTAAAVDGNIGIGRLLGAFEEGFYGAMPEGTAMQRKDCIALAEKMREHAAADEALASRLTMLLLDGAFYMKDFRRALELVKDGVSGQDEEWHEMLANKIGAHLAQSENRPLDAIPFFEKHMEKVRAWEQPQHNPENGLLMHKEAVLGFNEKRIGNLYRDAGRAEDAAAAYARAREYYRQALKLVGEDSKEYAAYQSELAEVPSNE